jgi:hypothetical protein
LPELDALVMPGGPCEGAVVVHQEDNASPHIDKVYKQWLQDALVMPGGPCEAAGIRVKAIARSSMSHDIGNVGLMLKTENSLGNVPLIHKTIFHRFTKG